MTGFSAPVADNEAQWVEFNLGDLAYQMDSKMKAIESCLPNLATPVLNACSKLTLAAHPTLELGLVCRRVPLVELLRCQKRHHTVVLFVQAWSQDGVVLNVPQIRVVDRAWLNRAGREGNRLARRGEANISGPRVKPLSADYAAGGREILLQT